MNNKVLPFFVTVMVSICHAQDFIFENNNQDKILNGINQTNEPCRVFVTYKSYPNSPPYITFTIQNSHNEFTDDNLLTPISSSNTKDGECSLIAGSSPDTVIVNNNTVIHRKRFVEFLDNWISETIFEFKNNHHQDLQSITFNVGAKKRSGVLACFALKKSELQKTESCFIK